MPVVTPLAASIDTVNAVPCAVPLRAAIGGSCRRSQRSRVSVRQTQAARVLGHEVDAVGADVVGREDQVAFVLPIFLVDQDDHAAGSEVGNQVGNWRHRHAPIVGGG